MIDITIPTDEIDEALQVAYDLSDKCKMVVQEGNVCFPAAHASISAFTEITLQSAAFKQYDCEEHTIGLPLGKIEKIISNASSGSDLSINLKNDSGRFTISVDKQKYRISPISLESMSSKPNLDSDYPTHIEIKRQDLKQSVSAADLFSDHISFNYNGRNGDLMMESTGDTDNIQTSISSEDLIASSGTSTKVTFGLDLLTNLCDSVPSGSTIKIMLKDNGPGLFEYDVAGGAGHVQYFLAPRIDRS